KAAAIATPTGTVATSSTETSPFSTAIVCGEATGSALRFSTSSRLVFSKSGEAKPASPAAPQTARAAVPHNTATTATWRGLITPRAFSRVRQIMPHNQARNELFFLTPSHRARKKTPKNHLFGNVLPKYHAEARSSARRAKSLATLCDRYCGNSGSNFEFGDYPKD